MVCMSLFPEYLAGICLLITCGYLEVSDDLKEYLDQDLLDKIDSDDIVGAVNFFRRVGDLQFVVENVECCCYLELQACEELDCE